MPVIVPFVSALNATPSSTGPLGPLSTVAGTVVLGQIVCWAAAVRGKSKRMATINNAAKCFYSSMWDLIATNAHTYSVSPVGTSFSEFSAA